MRSVVVALGAAILLAAVAGSCSSSDHALPAGAGGGGQSGTGPSAGQAGSPPSEWIPLEQWGGQVVETPASTQGLDCGPGCRTLLPHASKFLSGYAHGSDVSGVYDFLTHSLAFHGYQTSKVLELHPPEKTQDSLIMPSRWDNLVSFNQYSYPQGKLLVWDTSRNQVRTFFQYTQNTNAEQMDGGVYRTIVNDTYLFWLRDQRGIFRAHLTTGETKQLSSFAPICDRLSAVSTGLLCSTGQVVLIDQDSGAFLPLDPTPSLQMDGAASNDRSQVVWIDYRDPPGPTSSTDALRGGEVYLHTFATHETRRLTFDSPSAPRLKRQPFVDGDWVVWTEMPEDKPATVEWASAFYGAADRLVRLEISTGKKCRLAHQGGRVTLHNHHLFAHWIDPAQPDPLKSYHLVEVDLDHPDLPWKCE